MKTRAEEKARAAEKLPGFKRFKLDSFLAEIENLSIVLEKQNDVWFPRANISLGNQPDLHLLDWLLPEATKKKLTPPEWLLLVLTSSLHDLGLLVHKSEWENRQQNPAYIQFLGNFLENAYERDFQARTSMLHALEREQLFFQEFIRLHHAERTRNWITNKQLSNWDDPTLDVVKNIQTILKTLPIRFLENLANVCEAHHQDNLDKREYFPLSQRYGKTPEEIANVQYCALLLRALDILSIGNGRELSVPYRVVRFSDPVSADAWILKNESVISVFSNDREIKTSSTKNHEILLAADFVDEKKYFSFVEYVQWVDYQLQQINAFSKEAQASLNTKHYSFSWNQAKPQAFMEGSEPKPLRFDMDRGRLIDLLVGHVIYDDPTVAIREAVQNAIDAVRFRHYLELRSLESDSTKKTVKMGSVLINWSAISRELVIQDNGIGMNIDVIERFLLRIGSSFYNNSRFKLEHQDFTPISRFGIGILSYFMISDSIEIVTRQNNEASYRIRFTSPHSDYLLKKLDSDASDLTDMESSGTRIKMMIRASFPFDEESLEKALKYWILFPECDVFLLGSDNQRKQIGFSTMSKALEETYLTVLKANMGHHYNYVMNQESSLIDRDKYEFGFITSDGNSPKEILCSGVPNITAIVCNQGIRVDEVLPGFSERTNLPAILSVSENSRLHTNVARTDLERDAEYAKVGATLGQILSTVIQEKLSRNPNFSLSEWLDLNLGEFAYQNLAKVFEGSIKGEDSARDTFNMGRNLRKLPRSKFSPRNGSLHVIKIFLASPGDVAEERETVENVISELNETILDFFNISLRLVRWETDSVPGMGRPQSLINPLLEGADVFVGILGARFGTSTGMAGSGTEEEFNIAYENWKANGAPHILMYFKTTPIEIQNKDALEQLSKVLDFREKLASKGLFRNFRATKHFEQLIRRHLMEIIKAKFLPANFFR